MADTFLNDELNALNLLYKGADHGNATLTMTPSFGRFVCSSANITGSKTITMYSANATNAAEHTFTRVDSGTGTWDIVQNDGTTPIISISAGEWVTVSPAADGLTWYVSSKSYTAPTVVRVQTKTSNYTLTQEDSSSVIIVDNASDVTITVPNNLDIGWNAVFKQKNTGRIIFSAASGTTLENQDSYNKSSVRYSVVSAIVDSNSNGSSAIVTLGGSLGA